MVNVASITRKCGVKNIEFVIQTKKPTSGGKCAFWAIDMIRPEATLK